MSYYVCMRTTPRCEVWQDGRVFLGYDGKMCMAGKPIMLSKTIEGAFLFGGFPCTIREVEPVGKLVDEGELFALVAGMTSGERVRVPWVDRTSSFVRWVSRLRWGDPQKPPRKEWRVFDRYDDAKEAVGKRLLDREPEPLPDGETFDRRQVVFQAVCESLETIWTECVESKLRVDLISAVVMAQLYLCSDVVLGKAFVAEMRARRDVFARGYGLFGSYDGVLYVYRRP